MTKIGNMSALRFVLRELWDIQRKYFLFLVPIVLLPAITNYIQVTLPGHIISILLRGLQKEGLITSALFVAALIVARLLTSLCYNERKRIMARHNYYLTERLVRSAAKAPYQEFESFTFRQSYSFAQQCLSEGYLEKGIDAIIDILVNCVMLIPLLYILSYVTWWLCAAIILSAVIYVFAERKRSQFVFKMFQESNADDYQMLYARDALTNRSFGKEIRLFAMFEYVSSVAERLIMALSAIQKKQAGKTFKVYLLAYLYNALFITIVIGYVVYQSLQGNFNVADFVTLSFALLSVADIISKIAINVVATQTAGMFVRYYTEIVKNTRTDEYSNGLGSHNTRLDISDKSKINIENITFTYPNSEKSAISGITEVFDCGKTFGLVGENGSGKSTFIKLLLRLYSPDGGFIGLDGADANKYEIYDWQDKFSVILQDYNIYAFTIAENITFGKTFDADMIKKTTEFNASELDNYIGQWFAENGIELSGGEQQKIAFARAIAKDSPIFILDEPVASLSPKSEEEFYRVVSQDLKGKTVFLISHRLASCSFCDEILVFDGGRIVERGSHTELLQARGKYYEMFTAQASLYNASKNVETHTTPDV